MTLKSPHSPYFYPLLAFETAYATHLGFSLWYTFCPQESVAQKTLKSKIWSMGADVVIYLSAGQDGKIHTSWLCVLGTGLAMVVLSSDSVLSAVPPMQQV